MLAPCQVNDKQQTFFEAADNTLETLLTTKKEIHASPFEL